MRGSGCGEESSRAGGERRNDILPINMWFLNVILGEIQQPLDGEILNGI